MFKKRRNSKKNCLFLKSVWVVEFIFNFHIIFSINQFKVSVQVYLGSKLIDGHFSLLFNMTENLCEMAEEAKKTNLVSVVRPIWESYTNAPFGCPFEPVSIILIHPLLPKTTTKTFTRPIKYVYDATQKLFHRFSAWWISKRRVIAIQCDKLELWPIERFIKCCLNYKYFNNKKLLPVFTVSILKFTDFRSF